MNKAIFITGTDTGIGKSVVTGLLARYLLESGCNVITQKWIQTGSRGFSEDIKTHLKMMGKDKAYIGDYLESICPYSFKLACSPHLAAQSEGRKINPGKIKNDFRLLSDSFEFVLVEGVGGALVPFNQKRLVIDIAKDLRLPILIVVGNKLGAINHSLLTIEALRARRLKILGLVFNNFPRQNQRVLEDNQRIIESMAREEVFGAFNRQTDYKKLYQDFKRIGEKICLRING
ncbi:MAG: dethiobiotin synthase [Candidatus Omnitrophota bacterium]|nr:dethiobiotin synthase [Candidatus Omnitrophota bacterium]